jgi:hypothetical protein
MKRCNRCILPTTYPNITFDESGVCLFCRDFKETDSWVKKGDDLKRLVEEAKMDSGQYQAIVPISGGKDSAYALYVMRAIHGLRLLSINFDNGFRSSAAETNLKTLTTNLGVDYISLKPDWDLMRTLYAAFVKVTGEFCTVCNAMGYLTMMSFIMRMARQQQVSPKILIVGGWSRELEAMPGMYSFDFKYFHDVLAEAGVVDKLRQSPMVSEECLDLLIYAPDPRLFTKTEGSPINFIMLPEYIQWNLEQISRTLKNEVGWIVPPEAQNETHFDCVMYPVAKYVERRKYGFSQSTVTYSALVRAGQMSREEAIQKVQSEEEGVPVGFARFLDVLGLAESDVNRNGKWHPQRQ